MNIIATNPEVRFKDYEQASLYMKTGKIENSVPPRIVVDGASVVNPEYETAKFALGLIMSPHMKKE